MLQTIRDKLTGWFAVAILGVIALSLVVTLGNIDTGFTAGSVAASVDGEEILQSEFRQIYQQQSQQWEANYRTAMPEPVSREMANTVIQSMIRNQVVANHVRDEGYRVNDDEVIAAITAIPAFQVGGSFSQPAYEQVLGTQGLTPERFEFEQRQSMQVGQFIDGLGYSAFYTPAEFSRYLALDGETRDLDYVLIRAADLVADADIKDEAIEAYYRENQAQFQTPESTDLSYIEVDYAKIAEGVAVSDAEAEQYFAANPDEFIEPDARNARHILIAFGDDETAAAKRVSELRERIVAGESFDALAAEYSADTGSAATGGSLGWLGPGDSPASEFEDALFALKVGDISEPVRTEFGYHLIRLDGVREGKRREFADVRDDILQRLREAQASKVYGELLDELDEQALESMDGLKSVADTMGLPLGRVEQFTRSGGGALGNVPQLVDAVFSLEVLEDGENTPVIELSEGRAVVAHVDEYRAPAAQPLTEVRDAVVAQLRNSAATGRAAEIGNQMLGALNAGAAESIAAEKGLSWQRVAGVRRGDTSVSADLAAAVFQAPKPAAGVKVQYKGLPLVSGDFAVYRVTAVTPGNPEAYSAEDRAMRERQLAGRLGAGQATAVVEALVAAADISIAPDLLGTQTDVQ